MKRAIIGIAVFAALVWGLWLIAIPTHSVEKSMVRNLEAAGIKTHLKGFRKGAFMSFEAEALSVAVPGGGVLTLEDVSAKLSPSSLLKMKALVPFRGTLAEGTVEGTAELGSKDYSADVVLTGVRIEMLDLLKNFNVTAKGVLDAEVRTEANRSRVKFSIRDMYLRWRDPFNKLAAMFDKAQGVLSINGDIVNLDSVSLKGDNAYARAKGTINGSKADVEVEFMPDEDSALEPEIAGLIKRFRVSPGYYLIPVKTDIAVLKGAGA